MNCSQSHDLQDWPEFPVWQVPDVPVTLHGTDAFARINEQIRRALPNLDRFRAARMDGAHVGPVRFEYVFEEIDTYGNAAVPACDNPGMDIP